MVSYMSLSLTFSNVTVIMTVRVTVRVRVGVKGMASG